VPARDQVEIGLAENGCDPTQAGCAFHVKGLAQVCLDLSAHGSRVCYRMLYGQLVSASSKPHQIPALPCTVGEGLRTSYSPGRDRTASTSA
jgi:hypothetical protein